MGHVLHRDRVRVRGAGGRAVVRDGGGLLLLEEQAELAGVLLLHGGHLHDGLAQLILPRLPIQGRLRPLPNKVHLQGPGTLFSALVASFTAARLDFISRFFNSYTERFPHQS